MAEPARGRGRGQRLKQHAAPPPPSPSPPPRRRGPRAARGACGGRRAAALRGRAGRGAGPGPQLRPPVSPGPRRAAVLPPSGQASAGRAGGGPWGRLRPQRRGRARCPLSRGKPGSRPGWRPRVTPVPWPEPNAAHLLWEPAPRKGPCVRSRAAPAFLALKAPRGRTGGSAAVYPIAAPPA